MYFNGMFNMDELGTAEYAVFDDLLGGFEFFRNYKAWLGSQGEFTLTDKYRRKQKFLWGRPSIMIMNENPATMTHVDWEWIEGNCDVVHVTEPIVSFD